MTIAVLLGLAITCPGVASATVTGSPVTPSGGPTWSGQPYVKVHKRHNKNFYGEHYNVFKHSKGSH
jgi:hypothetical protein